MEAHWKSLIREKQIHQIVKMTHPFLSCIFLVHVGAQQNYNSFQPDCLKPKAKVTPEWVGGRHTHLTAVFFLREKWKKKVNMHVRSLLFSNVPTGQFPQINWCCVTQRQERLCKVCASFFEQNSRSESIWTTWTES